MESQKYLIMIQNVQNLLQCGIRNLHHVTRIASHPTLRTMAAAVSPAAHPANSI